MYDFKGDSKQILLTIPAFWKPILKAKADSEGRTVSGYIRHCIRVTIEDEIIAAGRGVAEVNRDRGAIMAAHPAQGEGAEVRDMTVGESDDPIENLARNFLDL